MIFKALLFITVITITSGSVIPTVKVLQGPSSKTVLLGPDGSAVDSVAPGGTVVTDDHGSGLVAAGPAILPLEPAIVVNGPAGSIATSYSHAGPAIVPAVAPAVVGPIAEPIVGNNPVGADEGAYVPDNHETLYDDGSYRGDH